MQKMTDSEWRAFVMQGTRTGKLATVRGDGRPHAVPVWFIFDGDDIIFNTWHSSVKAKNIRKNPNVTLAIDEEAFPYAFVMIEGTATLEDLPPEELRPYATAIARRYIGEERAEAYGARNSVEGELLVRVKITKVVSAKGVAN